MLEEPERISQVKIHITEIWNQKKKWFRDHAQADRVGAVIVQRLADDQLQDECRYLLRLKWHLHMSYQEVSYNELLQHVSAEKMDLLNELFTLVASQSYGEIDLWLERCERELPIVEDRWVKENGKLEF